MKIILNYFFKGIFTIFLTTWKKYWQKKRPKSEVKYGQTVLDCSENWEIIFFLNKKWHKKKMKTLFSSSILVSFRFSNKSVWLQSFKMTLLEHVLMVKQSEHHFRASILIWIYFIQETRIQNQATYNLKQH